MKRVVLFVLCIHVTIVSYNQIIDHRHVVLENVPASYIDLARANLHIAYEHTSHGSQIIDGMTGLYAWKGSAYAWNDGGSGGALDIDDNGITGGSDLGDPDFSSWAASTRAYLNNPVNSDVNVVMWAWCGELSAATVADVSTYLSLMSELEEDYPDVIFVYMTGHLDGTGLTGNLNLRNEQIRHHCIDNNKTLYDFADIESYDPGGSYYLDKLANDNCDYDSNGDFALDANWAISWQNSHTINVDWYYCPCAHSQPINGNLKAYAAWNLWARLASRSAPGSWTGNTSTDWNTASNWYGEEIPGPGTDVIITSSASRQPIISGTVPSVCNNLTINSEASLTIDPGQSLTVSGNLTNDGDLNIESAGLTLNGSLIINGSIAGTGIVTYNRLMPGSLYHYISSPVGSASLPSGQTYWLWDEPTGAWVETASFTSGVGYTMLTDGSPVSFTGSVVNFAGPIPATSPYSDCDFTGGEGEDGDYSARDLVAGREYGGGGWNLLGNPFTSAMKVTDNDEDGTNDFLNLNSSSFDPNYKAVYIYNGSTCSYIGIEMPGWENASGGFFGYSDIQAGQGFFVLAHCNTSTFSFTSALQIHNTTVPMTKSARTEDSWPGLQLKVKYGDNENSTLVVYNENMSAGLDPGYDVGQFSTGPDVKIYTTLVLKDNSVNYARQALPVADCNNNIIPVGIDSEQGGEVTFSANNVPLDGYKFWLEDRKSGTFTDLSNNTYTVTLPAQTYGTGRFFIYASTNTPTGINNPGAEDTGIRVWSSNDKVVIKGDVSDRAVCEVYDLRGQKIMEVHLIQGELNTLATPSGSSGVYLVRVTDGKKVTTKKVAHL